ncbi:MAG: type II toxin-antitoxin system RelE/ParE family toxin [Faecalimonas sp.]|nr:type II toxin-antitoxin system RelE/ParE family toxin [Faecalimonas sp.]
MTYQVKISQQVKTDLRDIYEYIAFTLLSPENASKLLSTLEKKILSLENFPKRFKLYHDKLWHDQELRVMPVNNFLIFYICDNQNQIVTILRIMYCGRDIPKELHNSKFN